MSNIITNTIATICATSIYVATFLPMGLQCQSGNRVNAPSTRMHKTRLTTMTVLGMEDTSAIMSAIVNATTAMASL